MAGHLPEALDWIGAIEAAIKVGQAGGKIRPAGEGFEEEEELPEIEPRVRSLPNSGWAECYDGKDGHQCNAIRVSECWMVAIATLIDLHFACLTHAALPYVVAVAFPRSVPRHNRPLPKCAAC